MAELATLATVATLAGTAVTAGATIYSGMQQQQMAEEIARQEELAGKNEFAAAQREADERRMAGALLMSRQQAIAAASGAGAGSDAPTIMKILGDTAARTQYGVDTSMYQGEQRRDDLNRSARNRRITGQYNFFGSIARAAGYGLGGVGDWAAAQG